MNATDLKSRLNNFVQYQQPTTNATPIVFVTGRNGFGKALQLQQGITYTYAVFGQRVSSAFVGFGCQFVNVGTGADFQFLDTGAGTGIVNVTVYSTRSTIRDPGLSGRSRQWWRSALCGPEQPMGRKRWSFIEIWPVINASTGSVTVHVNGVNACTITSVNTNFTGANAWWDAMGVRCNNVGGNPTMNMDDLYYCDTTTGAGLTPCQHVPRRLPGQDAVRDQQRRRAMDAAVRLELAGSRRDGNQSDTSYNYSSTPPASRTLFDFGHSLARSRPSSGMPADLCRRARTTRARAPVKSIVKISGTSYAGATNSLPDTSYAYFTDQWILNPSTGLNWVISDVNGAAYGYNMVS